MKDHTKSGTSSIEIRERHYLVSADHNCNLSDYKFVNKDAALIDGRMAGTHEVAVPELAYPFFYGVPPLNAKPQLIVGLKNKPLLDVYGLSGQHFISGRAKDLLTEIDPDAFEFVECETVNGQGIPIAAYWMMAVVRVVTDFDRENSDFVTYAQQNPDADDAETNPAIVGLHDIRMSAEKAEDWHAFFLLNYSHQFLFDSILADAWREHEFSGWTLTPLQPPTPQEFEQHLSFYNYPYWTERGSK